MTISRDSQRKIGSFLSYLQMALGIVVGLLYTPIMIRYLGQSEYGLYNTAASIISMLSILNLGFNSSYIRFYSVYKAKNDQERINKLNGLFLIIFLIIGLIALLCGIILSFNLGFVFKTGLTSAEYDIARILMLLLTVNLAVSFPMSVFSNIISAHERFVFLKLLSSIKTVVGPLITLPLLMMGFRSIAMVSVSFAISLIIDIMYVAYAFSSLKIKFQFKHFEKGVFKELLIFTSFIAINIVVDQLNWNIDKLLLARFKGTASVAIYSVGYTLYNYYMLFSTSISGVFSPEIHRIVNRTSDNIYEQRKSLTGLFIKVGRIQFQLLSLICTGLIFFGQAFIEYWVGSGYQESYYVVLLLAIPGSIPLIQNLGIEIQRAENRHQFRSLVYIAMAAINLILSIYLCQLYGPIGSAVGTAISLIVANGVIMNIYYHKRCNIDIVLFWKNILQICPGMIVPIIVGILIMRYAHYSGIVSLAVFIIAYSAVYCISLRLFSMNDYEKQLIAYPLHKLIERYKK